MTNHNPEQTCSNCFAFVLKGGKNINNDGYCQLSPPMRLEPDRSGSNTVPKSTFPTVTPTTWCAQWARTWEAKPARGA